MIRNPLLPRRTLDYLATGAAEGSRNDELLNATCQFRDAGISQSDAERELLPRAELDGLSTAEALRTIRSAYQRPARRGAGRGFAGYPVRPGYTVNRNVPVPVDPVTATRNFLKGFECGEADLGEASPIRPPDDFTLDGACLVSMLYGPDERINVVTNYKLDADGKARPADAGVTLARNEMISRLKRGDLQSDAGGWLRMNPVDGAGVADANVTQFRFALIEGDTLPLELQLPLLCRLPLPVAAIITSAGKSLHAWIQVDCRNAEEYRTTVSKMLGLLARFGVDVANKNPSRLSRLPGATRRIGKQGDGRQRILYLNPDPEQRRIL